MKIFIFAFLTFGFAASCSLAREANELQQQDDTPLGGISGLVVNERGQAVSGVTVSAHRMDHPFMGIAPWAETDGAGKVTLEHLELGTYAICAKKGGDGYREICSDILRKDRAPTAALTRQAPTAAALVVIGPKAGTVSGTITDAVTGAPLNAGLWIRTSPDNGRFVQESTSSHFTFLIPPDADLELEVRAPGYQLWRSSVDGGLRGKPFRIKSEEKRTLEIRLWSEPH